MRNEKLPLVIFLVCGVAALALFALKAPHVAVALGVCAFVSLAVFAEAKWHNIHQEELERHKAELRECQEKIHGKKPEEDSPKKA